MLRAVLFDFDGTIADSKDILYMVYPHLAEKYRFKLLSMEELEKLRSMPMIDRLREVGLPLTRIPGVVRDGRAMITDLMSQCPPFPGIPELISSLIDEGLFLGIVSSNSHKNIIKFLEAHHLQGFSEVRTTSGFMGKHRVLKDILSRHGIPKEQALYVGDEVRDILCCKKMSMEIASVTWGYDGRDLLEQEKPDYLVHTPEELLKVIRAKLTPAS